MFRAPQFEGSVDLKMPDRVTRKDFKHELIKLINPDYPLGPVDAHLIKNNMVAARLFDPHNTSFHSLLRKDTPVLLGRRGSGKTALLNSYLYKMYIRKSERLPRVSPFFDLNDYSLVINLQPNRIFDHMRHMSRMPNGAPFSIETIIELWEELLSDHIISQIINKLSDEERRDDSLQALAQYIRTKPIDPKISAHIQVWGRSTREIFKDFLRLHKKPAQISGNIEFPLEALDAYLGSRRKSAIILFDSLDDYRVGEFESDRIVGGLLRYVAHFNLQNQNMRLKVAFPSEIFPEIQRASANPLKDFPNYAQLSWTSMELAQIAAFRYKIFLEHFSPDLYKEIYEIDLTLRDGAHRFWNSFFAEEQTNRYGQSEAAMIYMIRHTQLLPRQLFRILEKVIISSHSITGGYETLTKSAVTDAIENMETVIAGEIFSAFLNIYPKAELFGKAIFGGFPTVFSYDELEDRWRKVGRSMTETWRSGFELYDFIEMLLRMGILGEVKNETERYMETKFFYHLLVPAPVSDKALMAIHPIFSRYFSCSLNKQGKAILPQGALF